MERSGAVLFSLAGFRRAGEGGRQDSAQGASRLCLLFRAEPAPEKVLCDAFVLRVNLPLALSFVSNGTLQLVHQRQQQQQQLGLLDGQSGPGVQYPPVDSSVLELNRRDPGQKRSPKPL